GLDRAWFLADLAGPAKEAFTKDQRLCHEYGAHGFPTFLVRGGGHERILCGYTRFPTFAALFDSLADKPLERFRSAISEASVLGFVGNYGSAAAREVAEVFGVTDSDAETLLRQLVTKGQIEGHLAGTGTMYRMPMAGAYCDPLTGGCG
ncbi:MAG: hypothetical protein ACOYM2_07690, partial [Rectinemataceae bacterium]